MRKALIAASCLALLAGCAGVDKDDYEDLGSDDQEIVGGTNTDIAAHPWQVSFQSASGSHFCGGSILSDRWVITAQHCVDKSGATTTSPATVRIAAGSSTLSGMSSTGQIRAIDEIIPYPGYVDADQGKDVALLHLASPLAFSSTVAPIAPATAADAAAGLTDPGVVSTVTGWGALSSGGSSPDRLQEVDVPIVSNAVADAAYPENITADQLAAGDMVNGGEDSCQGDSGGPLIVSKGSGAILAGVVSWGYGCADVLYPGLYARVSSFDTWIADVTQGALVSLLNAGSRSGSSGTWQHFTLDVPPGTPVLNVHLAGGTGDADLYVRQAGQPTSSLYDCRPYAGGNSESCNFGNPAAGTWYISLYAYSAFSGATLRATTYDATGTPPPPSEVCGDGADNDGDGLADCDDADCSADPGCAAAPEPVIYNDSAGLAKNTWKHYPAFAVTPGTAFSAFLDQLANNPDLYVRFGAQPTTTTYDCRPYLAGDESCNLTVPAGVSQVYVSTRGRSSGTNSYNLSVTYTPAP